MIRCGQRQILLGDLAAVPFRAPVFDIDRAEQGRAPELRRRLRHRSWPLRYRQNKCLPFRRKTYRSGFRQDSTCPLGLLPTLEASEMMSFGCMPMTWNEAVRVAGPSSLLTGVLLGFGSSGLTGCGKEPFRVLA